MWYSRICNIYIYVQWRTWCCSDVSERSESLYRPYLECWSPCSTPWCQSSVPKRLTIMSLLCVRWIVQLHKGKKKRCKPCCNKSDEFCTYIIAGLSMCKTAVDTLLNICPDVQNKCACNDHTICCNAWNWDSSTKPTDSLGHSPKFVPTLGCAGGFGLEVRAVWWLLLAVHDCHHPRLWPAHWLEDVADAKFVVCKVLPNVCSCDHKSTCRNYYSPMPTKRTRKTHSVHWNPHEADGP